MCKRLKDDAEWAVAPYRLSLPDLTVAGTGVGVDSVGVGQYQTRSLKLFEDKIGQFPSGSKFVLDRWYRPQNNDERTLEAEVRTILEKHGRSLGTLLD
jgi:hypothetical protein